MKKKNIGTNPNYKVTRWFLPILAIIAFGWLGTAFTTIPQGISVQNDPARQQIHLQQEITPTPEQTPTEFPAEVIKEGKPVGIIVGAVAIMVIIFISTIPSLFRGQVSERPNDKK